MNRLFPVLLLAAAALAAGDDDSSKDRGEKVFTAQLVRAGELTGMLPPETLFGSAGSDPLRSGAIEVRERRKVEVWLRGATPDRSYQTYFCRLPVTTINCFGLGLVRTDASGNARELLDLVLAGDTSAGVFFLTRSGLTANLTEFVSGFSLAPAPLPAPAAVAIRLQGRLHSVDPGRSAFRIIGFPIEIVVGTATRYKHVDGLRNLSAGLMVTAEGYAMSDGRVFAAEVEVDTRGPKN